MKAVILCAGDGTRLRPLTETTPKPLVELHNDKTILEYALDALPEKIKDVYLVVNQSKVHHFELFLRMHEFPFNVYLSIQEGETTGTFSALASVTDMIEPDETFLVFNGDDIFKKEDMEIFITLPTPVCGMYSKVSDARYRTCDVDETTRTITNFRAQKEDEVGKPVQCFTGMYLLSGEFFSFDPIVHNGEFSIPDTVFHYYAKVGYYTVSSWYQINTLEEFQTVRSVLKGAQYKPLD